jgi:hypothetical protein
MGNMLSIPFSGELGELLDGTSALVVVVLAALQAGGR